MEGLAVGKEKESDSWRGFFPLSLPFGFLFTSTNPSMNQISNIAMISLSPMWLRLGLGQWFSFVSTFYKAYAYLFFWSLRNVSSFKSPCHLQHKPMVNHVNIVHHVNGKDKIKIGLKLLGQKRHVNFFNLLREKGGANNFFIAERKELWKLLLSAWALFCLWQKCWPDKFPEFANTMWPKTLPISRSK